MYVHVCLHWLRFSVTYFLLRIFFISNDGLDLNASVGLTYFLSGTLPGFPWSGAYRPKDGPNRTIFRASEIIFSETKLAAIFAEHQN